MDGLCIPPVYLVLLLGVVPGGYPRIVENPTLKSVEKDRNTVMICSAAGDPEPSIVWYKDYVPVDMSDPRRKLLPTGNDVIGHNEYLISTFQNLPFLRSIHCNFCLNLQSLMEI